MVPCSICSSDINDDALYYMFSDMGPDIVSAIENRLGREVDVNGTMCVNCFTSATQMSAPSETHPEHEDNELQLPCSNICIWCQNSLYLRRTHSLPKGHERCLILERISPRQIPDNALVCHSCWVRVRYILERQQYMKAIPKGSPLAVNITKCVVCLRSLARTYRHSIPNGPVRSEINKRIQPREIPPGGVICFACWVSAHKSMKNADTINQTDQDLGSANTDPDSENTDPDSANTDPDVQCGSCGLSLIGRESHILHINYSTINAADTNPEATKNNYVCNECLKFVNHCWAGDRTPPPVRVGHRNVCINCGRSVLKIRKYLAVRPDATERDQSVTAILSEWLRPYQIKDVDEVCAPCRSRAKRVVDRIVESIDVSPSFIPEIQTGNVSFILGLPATVNVPLGDLIEKLPENLQPPIINGYIELSNVRRAPNNSGNCIFKGCTAKERLRVPPTIRGRIAKSCNYYIPKSARICKHHAHKGLFDQLYNGENAITTFSGEHFEDMIGLLSKGAGSVDFSDPETMDQTLFQYFFGFTHSEYCDLLNECPRLNNPKIKYGLNALLLKMQSGDSNERMAKLFQISRRSLESNMKQARSILVNDFIPNNLGSIM